MEAVAAWGGAGVVFAAAVLLGPALAVGVIITARLPDAVRWVTRRVTWRVRRWIFRRWTLVLCYGGPSPIGRMHHSSWRVQTTGGLPRSGWYSSHADAGRKLRAVRIMRRVYGVLGVLIVAALLTLAAPVYAGAGGVDGGGAAGLGAPDLAPAGGRKKIPADPDTFPAGEKFWVRPDWITSEPDAAPEVRVLRPTARKTENRRPLRANFDFGRRRIRPFSDTSTFAARRPAGKKKPRRGVPAGAEWHACCSVTDACSL